VLSAVPLRVRSLFAGFGLSLLVACGAAEPEMRKGPEAPTASTPARRARRAARPELDPAQIVFSLRGREQEFDACAPGSEGVVQVSWRVSASGAPRQTKIVHSTLADPKAAECVRSKVGELRFPSTGRSSSARWTFVFGLERGAASNLASQPKNRRRGRKAKARARAAEPGLSIDAASPGFLEPARIESVVQSGFRLYAHCYRDGLARDPALGGAVRLKFVIDGRGAVERVTDVGSDLPDQRVINCVAQGFFALEFPKPERGSVHVLYRIQFDAS
jgi:hypothetical protein